MNDLDLNNLRSKINKIDGKIAELLLQRFAVVKDISEYKKARGLDVLQKNREAEVLQNISDKIDKTGLRENQEYKKYIIEIYETILKTSKSSQK